MRVLIGFECGGRVRDAFIARGHFAISCDTKPDEAGAKDKHWQIDIKHPLAAGGWDLIILHPPCQFLSVSGNAHHANSAQRRLAVQRVIKWWDLAVARCDQVALENPVGVLSSEWCQPAQYVQPYHFGEDASKRTGLWLKGLPKLRPTEFIDSRWVCCGEFLELEDKYGCPNCEGEFEAVRRWGNQCASGQNKLGPSPTRASDRARTYQGIANAMANQWG